ncbi:MAG: methionine--tRNA ligase subunit beta, partial [Clostridia bacterium]|nr:methionine--tRNA ligase subunit beta [Clostridia bacterium]
RTVAMIEKYFDGLVPAWDETAVDKELDVPLHEHCAALPALVEEQMNKLQFSQALVEIWKVIGECNKYIDATQPWVLGRDPEKQGRLGNVLLTLAECIRFVAVLIGPVMPHTPARIFEQLGVSDPMLMTWESLSSFGKLPAGTKVCKGEALFPRLDVKKELEALAPRKEEKKPEPAPKKEEKKEPKKVEIPEGCVSIDEFFRCKLRVAKVLSCEAVKKSDKLLKFDLDLGKGEHRTILSGIRKFYEPEQLLGKNLVIIANLPPRKMMGIESNGMILSAVEEKEDGSEYLRVLTVEGDIAPGSEVG